MFLSPSIETGKEGGIKEGECWFVGRGSIGSMKLVNIFRGNDPIPLRGMDSNANT